jgi:hypothetical protein
VLTEENYALRNANNDYFRIKIESFNITYPFLDGESIDYFRIATV